MNLSEVKMNRSEFLNTAKITRCPITAVQEGDHGYSLNMIVQHEGEEAQKFTMMYQGEPRYFKSLAGVEITLKKNGIMSFNVKMAKESISKRTRTPAEANAAAEEEKEIAEAAKG